jgi:hypothetical protein
MAKSDSVAVGDNEMMRCGGAAGAAGTTRSAATIAARNTSRNTNPPFREGFGCAGRAEVF